MSKVHGNTGSRNARWNGGTTVTNRGYRKVMAKDHPRADRDGYVPEHLAAHADERGRKTTEVTCDTCGKVFTKKTSTIKNHNFCSKKCVNPSIWVRERR